MKLQTLFLALAMPCTFLFSQTTNDAALKAALSEKQILDTPAEREGIKAVCLAESQAYFDLDYNAWAALHLQSENEHLTWNNPDGSFGDQSGWKSISEGMKGWYKVATKNAGKLSQSSHAFVIRGNMAYVNFDQTAAQADGKIEKSKEHRILLYDAPSHTWKILAVNAYADHTSTNMVAEEKEKAAIQQVILMETEYWLDRNLEAWSNSFVQSPYLLWTVTNGGEPGDVLTVRGWDGLKGFMKNWFGDEANSVFANEMRKNTNTRDHWQIEIRGDVAWASFDQHMVNSTQTTVSTETRVLERVNGAWRITMQSSLADFKDAVPPIRSRY